MGRRRWRIDASAKRDHAFRDDVELKLLRQFSPTHEWILDPGDVLYLPPGVAHEGVAMGECMTFSVGMRAPSNAELILDFAEFIAEPMGDDKRLTDRDLASSRHPGEITESALRRVRASMPQFTHVDKYTFALWFGKFITRYRAAHDAAPPPRRIAAAQLVAKLATHGIARNPWSRMAWMRRRNSAMLFVAGDSFACPAAVAKLVAESRQIEGATLLEHPGSEALFVDLIHRGHWLLRRTK
jgi:50S ribosomal protein L16 3-hydroxylase